MNLKKIMEQNEGQEKLNLFSESLDLHVQMSA